MYKKMSRSISRFNNNTSSYQEAYQYFLKVSDKLSKARISMEEAKHEFENLDGDADEQERINALADMAASEIYFEKASDEYESARINYQRFC